MNSINLSGRLVRDPECREFQDGKTVCDFTIANNGYKKEDPLFIKIKAWDKRAKSCAKFCKKGSLVNVTGALRLNSWQAKDGTNRKEIYVLASDIEFVHLGSEEGTAAAKPANTASQPQEVEEPISEEELETVPF